MLKYVAIINRSDQKALLALMKFMSIAWQTKQIFGSSIFGVSKNWTDIENILIYAKFQQTELILRISAEFNFINAKEQNQNYHCENDIQNIDRMTI